ncbi:MAG: RimK family alpha-L-glutamate ligase [Epsilonproteobacteria bacterium]|nr:RimK family alpha-L-glutamate ligase [Campylobacterota bacterium]
MRQAVLVYNLVHETNREWAEQIDAFVVAFKKCGFELLPVSSVDAYDYIKRYKRYINFVLYWDKDLYLAELLEATGVPVFNTSTAIRVCDDKALTYIKLKNHRLPTPKTLVLPFTFGQNVIKFYDRIKTLIAEKGFAYPFVLKQRFGSFGEQVYLITSEVMFKKMLQTIGDKELLIQEFIEESSGRDFRVNVVGREAVSIVMRVNQGNFRSNVHQGGIMSSVPYPDRRMLKLAVQAAKAVGADFAGVDILVNAAGEPLVIEVNSNARTIAVEEASKVYVSLFIARYIKKHYKLRKLDLY